MTWYTLDDNEQPVLLADDQRYSVDAHKVWPPLKTTVDGYEVSTVFLGLDHGYAADVLPVLWETMIFGDGPVPWASGDDHEYQERYTSADAARSGHNQTVQRLRDKIVEMTPRTDPATPEERTMPEQMHEDGTLLAHGFRAGQAVTTPDLQAWTVVHVQNDLALVTNAGLTTWYRVAELRAALAPEGAPDAAS